MIEELQKKNVEQSTAQYVCSLVFVDTDGKTLTYTQKCEGIIRIFAQGNNGFGYDPYFFVPDLQKTMAELTIEEKNNISHHAEILRGWTYRSCQRLIWFYLGRCTFVRRLLVYIGVWQT